MEGEFLTKFESIAYKNQPNESCALIYNNTLHLVNNAATDKVAAFLIPQKEMLSAYRSKTGLQAIIHSHTMTSEQPSETDIKKMKSLNCSWAIYSTLTEKWFLSERGSNEDSFSWSILRNIRGN